MACDVTALMLYSIDALAEAEVVSLAAHVEECMSCRKRLTDRDEFRAAVRECVTRSIAPEPVISAKNGAITGKRRAKRAA